MYKIEIGNKIGEKRKFECDGTANIYALFRELNITDYPYRLKVGQNKNGVSVQILADNDFDTAIAKILTNNRDTLNDSLIVTQLCLFGNYVCKKYFYKNSQLVVYTVLFANTTILFAIYICVKQCYN